MPYRQPHDERTSEVFKPASEIVGDDKVAEVLPKLAVTIAMIAFGRRLLNGPVHSFDLSVGLGMLHLGQAMFDGMLVADAIENVVIGISVMGVIGAGAAM
jgi:hypothetical protein